MKAISIRSPWAALIASGRKIIELRTWTTRHRGPLLVCASLTPKLTLEEQGAADEHGLRADELPRGVAVCVVDLWDVNRARRSDRAAACSDINVGNEYAWHIRVVTPVDPIRLSGRLGLWTVNNSVLSVNGRPFDVQQTSEVHCVR